MPAVTRRTDNDVTHCSTPNRLGHSPDVYANGLQISRQGDYNTPHLEPGGSSCVPHSAPITTGSTSVFINGKGCGRVGDSISGCTAVGQGSPDVFAG